jgi:cytosine/adenosine deaminase-related metal-dependent hydrolase
MARTICFKARTILEGFDDQGCPIVHENAALVVRGGRICEIGAFQEFNDVETVSLPAESIIVPGLINAHHHVGLTPLRLGSSDYPLELWFASRLALRDVDLYTDTLFSAFEMLRTGITTVQHLHSRVAGGPDRLVAAGQEVIRAYCDIGMRASYSLALRDQNRLVYGDDRAFADRVGGDTGAALHRYFDRFTTSLEDQLAAFHALRENFADNSLIRVQLAPANLHWLSDEALVRIADEATQHGVPMHMHLLETPYQRVYAQRRTGDQPSPISRSLALSARA